MTAALTFFPLLSPEFLALQKYAVHRRFAFSFFQSLSRAAVSAGQKAGKIIESNLKIKSTVFENNQRVKVVFPKKPPRFGKISLSKPDSPYFSSAKVIFDNTKTPRTVNKDYIFQ